MTPLKTMKDLPGNWKDIILNQFREGKSITHAYKAIGISKSQHYRFMEDYPEYADVMEDGLDLAQMYWIDEGMKNLGNRNYNNPLFNRLTAVILRWDDKAKDNTPPGDDANEDDKKKGFEKKYGTKPETTTHTN